MMAFVIFLFVCVRNERASNLPSRENEDPSDIFINYNGDEHRRMGALIIHQKKTYVMRLNA